jgi:hypothetical protein
VTFHTSLSAHRSFHFYAAFKASNNGWSIFKLRALPNPLTHSDCDSSQRFAVTFNFCSAAVVSAGTTRREASQTTSP